MARNLGQHRPDGPPPTDPTMSVHRRTMKKDAVSLQEAEEALFHFKQGEHMSNH